MSNQVTTAFVDQFSQGITHLSQQMTAKSRQATMHEPMQSKKKAFDQVGAIRLVRKSTRHAEIDQVEVPHKRRWVNAAHFWGRDFIDESDKLEMLNDPTNSYTQAFAAANARHWDRTLIGREGELGGLLGDNLTGEEGDTRISLPAGQTISDGTAKLTFAMVKEGVRKLRQRNALNLPGDEIYLATTAYQEEGYIDDEKVSNRDFTMKVVIDEGGVNTHYRVKFLYMEDADDSPEGQILPLSGTIRTNVMFVRSGACMGIRKDAYGRVAWIDEREAWQVSGGINIGCTRKEEIKVLKLLVLEN